MARFPFDIVGFDLDGTLLDTAADLGAAMNHALALADRPPVPVERVADLIGGGARRMLERALVETGGVPDGGVEALFPALLAHYEANIAVHSRLYHGGEAMLDALAGRGAKLAVVTNKLERLAVMLLDALGLSDRFACVIGGDTMGPGRAKPHPEPLYEMLRRLGGGRGAFVGDTTFDAGAARAANLPFVAVSFGFNDVPPDTMGAAAVIDYFDALVPALERL